MNSIDRKRLYKFIQCRFYTGIVFLIRTGNIRHRSYFPNNRSAIRCKKDFFAAVSWGRSCVVLPAGIVPVVPAALAAAVRISSCLLSAGVFLFSSEAATKDLCGGPFLVEE